MWANLNNRLTINTKHVLILEFTNLIQIFLKQSMKKLTCGYFDMGYSSARFNWFKNNMHTHLVVKGVSDRFRCFFQNSLAE